MSWAVCVRSFHRRRSWESVADEWRSGWTVSVITGVAAIIANHKTGTMSDSVGSWRVAESQRKSWRIVPTYCRYLRSVPLTDRKAHKSIPRAQFQQAIIDRLQQRLIVVDDSKSLSDQFDVLHNNTWPSDVSPPWADGKRLITDCRVLSLSDRRYSLNPLSQTRIDWVGRYRIRWTFKLSCVWH